MEIKVLKQLFDNGALNAVVVAPADLSGATQEEWVVVVETNKGFHEYLTVANTKKNKLFKRLPAAIEDARRIGFQQVMVSLPPKEVPIRR